MAPTIYDIAKKCNCSTTTVSKVLNNSGSISESKKKEVLRAVKELGYTSSYSAKSLASSNRSSQLIGVYLHISEDRSITHELFSEIMNSFRKVIEKEHYDLCFVRNLDDKENISYDDLLFSRGIDGVLVLSDNKDSKKFKDFMENSQKPLVAFDMSDFIDTVSSNNKESIAAMVDYLVSKGHRRICYVCAGYGYVANERKQGFLEGLKRNNIPFDERMIVGGPYYCANSAKIATDNALGTGLNPTVIMYPDDYTAISAIPYLRNIGIKVPLDISITGFDGVRIAKVMRPSITTTCQDTHKIGEEAAKLLLKKIHGKEIKQHHIVVETSLLIGQSVKEIN